MHSRENLAFTDKVAEVGIDFFDPAIGQDANAPGTRISERDPARGFKRLRLIGWCGNLDLDPGLGLFGWSQNNFRTAFLRPNRSFLLDICFPNAITRACKRDHHRQAYDSVVFHGSSFPTASSRSMRLV